jgi:hypothetical protein
MNNIFKFKSTSCELGNTYQKNISDKLIGEKTKDYVVKKIFPEHPLGDKIEYWEYFIQNIYVRRRVLTLDEIINISNDTIKYHKLNYNESIKDAIIASSCSDVEYGSEPCTKIYIETLKRFCEKYGRFNDPDYIYDFDKND